MKYPNNIKKEFKKVITHSNRGMSLENIINDANQYYLDNDIALIYKKPTPIQVVKVQNKKIVDAFFKEPSTLDYSGLYKGKYIEFDAKETKLKNYFPLSNIHDHQINHIRNVIKQHGISFLIIAINNEYYLLNGLTIIDYIDSNDIKNMPYDFIKEKGFLLKYNYLRGLDYIKVIDNIMEEL